MILANQQQPRDERPENLSEDVMRDLLPRKTLPDSKAERDSGIKVPTRCRTTCDNRKGNTNSVRQTDLENGAERGLSSI